MITTRLPNIVVTPPGPKAQAIIAADQRVTSTSLTRAYGLVALRGEGMMVEDPDGNQFLDFTAGVAVCTTGHCHPKVVRAIQDQCERLMHMISGDFFGGPIVEISERLAGMLPGENRVFLSNSGTEAVEAAIKLARYATRRPRFIAFIGAFHGRTMGALSLTNSKVTQREGFAPLLSEVTHVPFPNPYRPLWGDGSDIGTRCVDWIETLFKTTVPASEVAAIVVEPIQGEGGYLIPPPDFLPALRALCDEHGILLILDEVQSGMGRTGRMWACDHTGVVPDILCVAKGLASGLPIGATIAHTKLMNWPPGSHGNTFGGNPVACAAAVATLEVMEEEGLIANAARQGEMLLNRLHDVAGEHPNVGQIRGLGLMVAVEFVKDRKTKEPHPALRDRLVQGCFERGLLTLPAGPSALRFSPPLIVGDSDIEAAVGIFGEVVGG